MTKFRYKESVNKLQYYNDDIDGGKWIDVDMEDEDNLRFFAEKLNKG